MALLGPYAAVLKGKTFFDSYGSKIGLPRDGIDNLPSTAVLPIDIHNVAEDFLSFRTLCDVQSSLVNFAPNRAIAWGPPQWQAP